MKEDQIWWCWFQPEAHHHLQLEAVDEFCRLDSSHHPSSAVTPALPPERDSLCLFHQRFSNYKNSTQALSCKHLHEIFFSYRHLKGKYSFTIDAETPMRDFLFDFVQREKCQHQFGVVGFFFPPDLNVCRRLCAALLTSTSSCGFS